MVPFVVPFAAALLLVATPLTAQPAAPAPAQAPPAVADGRSEVRVQAGPVELQVFLYRPANWSRQRILLVMHGVERNAD
ncbi:MAG: hypothetical protein FJ306_00550, partial [Planctomycetes bacterium]|nr:hypothetical protein [Planctomycetota bacterium]